MRLVCLSFCYLLLLLQGICQGGNLYAPYSLESTHTLPAGVRDPRFLSVFIALDHAFDGAGQLGFLGDRLNKPVDWKTVINSLDNNVLKSMVTAVLEKNNIPLNGKAGDVTGAVNSYASIMVPAFAVGLTRKLTAALAVPIYNVDVSVDTGFVKSAQGVIVIDSVCKTTSDCRQYAERLNHAIERKLSYYGYEPLAPISNTQIGDMLLITKLKTYETEESSLTSKLTLTLPTGSSPSPDRIIDANTGDGRFKLGGTVIYDHALAFTKINFYGSYTAQLPHTLVKRLPESADNSLSKVKESVSKDWGHLVSIGGYVDLPIKRWGLTFSPGYSFQYQSQAHYSGANFASRLRYRLLDDLEPYQALHALVAAINFSTVDWYRQKRFALPFQVNLVYALPIAGRNTPSNSVFSGEVVAFF